MSTLGAAWEPDRFALSAKVFMDIFDTGRTRCEEDLPMKSDLLCQYRITAHRIVKIGKLEEIPHHLVEAPGFIYIAFIRLLTYM